MPPPDKENQRNRQFEGKRVVDARKAGPGGEAREERNNQRNTEVCCCCLVQKCLKCSSCMKFPPCQTNYGSTKVIDF